MKTLIIAIIKAAARFVLNYAGDAAAAVLDRANDRLKDKAYAAELTAWARESATLLADFSAALEDSTITDAERDRVADSAQALADRLKALVD